MTSRKSFSKLLAKTITQLIGLAALFTVLVALFTFAVLALFSTPAVAQEEVNPRSAAVRSGSASSGTTATSLASVGVR